MKSNYKLGEDQKIPFWIPFFTHMKWIPLMIKCTFLLWLACFIFWSMLAWEHYLRIPLEILWLALFWVLLAFLGQPFWLLQLSISNISQITTSMLAFQVPHLVYLHIGGNPYTREKWPPSKNYFWHSLEITRLIDPSDGFNLMSNLDSFFKFFISTCLSPFLSYQMIFNSH